MCAALNRRLIFYNVYYDADTLSEYTASGKWYDDKDEMQIFTIEMFAV